MNSSFKIQVKNLILAVKSLLTLSGQQMPPWWCHPGKGDRSPSTPDGLRNSEKTLKNWHLIFLKQHQSSHHEKKRWALCWESLQQLHSSVAFGFLTTWGLGKGSIIFPESGTWLILVWPCFANLTNSCNMQLPGWLWVYYLPPLLGLWALGVSDHMTKYTAS